MEKVTLQIEDDSARPNRGAMSAVGSAIYSDPMKAEVVAQPQSQQQLGHSSWVTAAFHLVTVIIGAGVLSLPSSFALLGWILGPLLLLLFGVVGLFCAFLMTEVYEVDGRKHVTYRVSF